MGNWVENIQIEVQKGKNKEMENIYMRIRQQIFLLNFKEFGKFVVVCKILIKKKRKSM